VEVNRPALLDDAGQHAENEYLVADGFGISPPGLIEIGLLPAGEAKQLPNLGTSAAAGRVTGPKRNPAPQLVKLPGHQLPGHQRYQPQAGWLRIRGIERSWPWTRQYHDRRD
jgi:hypothetical protein